MVVVVVAAACIAAAQVRPLGRRRSYLKRHSKSLRLLLPHLPAASWPNHAHEVEKNSKEKAARQQWEGAREIDGARHS